MGSRRNLLATVSNNNRSLRNLFSKKEDTEKRCLTEQATSSMGSLRNVLATFPKENRCEESETRDGIPLDYYRRTERTARSSNTNKTRNRPKKPRQKTPEASLAMLILRELEEIED
jgi:hypothetical protein